MPNVTLPDAPARPPVPAYPPGTVRALLDTDHVTSPTRAVLRARLADDGWGAPRFLDPHAFLTLRSACARLVPQLERPDPVNLAAALDARLARAEGNGWRYATMPPDPDAYALGLRGLDEHAHAAYGAPFARLDATRQDAVLRAVQCGAVRGGAWDEVPAQTFFVELLADVTECYYGHPLAQEEIGYVGMADAPGWRAIGLDELAPREPRARRADDA